VPAAVDDGDDEDRRDERSLQEPHERAAAAVLSPRRRRRLSRHGARELIELTMSVCSLCRLCDIWVSNSGSRSTTTSRKRSHKEEAEWRTGRVGCCEVVDGDDTIRHVVVAGGFSRGKKKTMETGERARALGAWDRRPGNYVADSGGAQCAVCLRWNRR
jgi:hypothetical protein